MRYNGVGYDDVGKRNFTQNIIKYFTHCIRALVKLTGYLLTVHQRERHIGTNNYPVQYLLGPCFQKHSSTPPCYEVWLP